MSFKEYFILTESKKLDDTSYCLMAFPDESSIKNITKIHKQLNIKAKENITPKHYHSTIIYFKSPMNINPFIDYLNEYKFITHKSLGKKLDFLGNSYSLLLESTQLSNTFNKLNEWLIYNNYPKPPHPKYKPHLAFCYEPHKSWIPPELDKEYYQIPITYDNFKLTKNHETIWKLK